MLSIYILKNAIHGLSLLFSSIPCMCTVRTYRLVVVACDGNEKRHGHVVMTRITAAAAAAGVVVCVCVFDGGGR